MTINIDAIKARAEAATPGPWEAKCIHVYMGGEGQYRVGPPNRPPSFQGVVSMQDAEFFAHAREDVPALVAEVERLRAQVARDKPVLDAAQAWWSNRFLDGDALRSDERELGAAVDGWKNPTPEPEHPPLTDLVGLDLNFTGGLDPAEHVRRQYGGEATP